MGVPRDDPAALAALAQAIARPLDPPAGLVGPARELFVVIAADNTTRTWGAAHAQMLADYCRVSVAWSDQMAGIETEGALVANKMSQRFAVLRALSMERARFAHMLGLRSDPSEDARGRDPETRARLRGLGHQMARVHQRDADGLLS